MVQLYAFLIEYAPWILGACTLSFIWNFIRMLRRQRDIQAAYYYLERDKAAKNRDRAMWMMILALLIGGLVLFVNLRIAPSLPEELFIQQTPTPRPTFAISSSGTRTIDSSSNDIAFIPFPTSTPVIAPTATLSNPSSVNRVLPPQAQATRPTLEVDPIYDGCDENISIEQPPSGSTLSEGVSIFGRAVAADFDYYTIQIRGPGTDNVWIDLLDGTVNSSVENGFLGTGRFDESWRNGVYQIEMQIIDQAGNAAGSCRIQIGILN